MLPSSLSATNRLPVLLKASPTGSLNPEAKMVCTSPGVISMILPPRDPSDTNRLPALLKASSAGTSAPNPETKVLCTPPGVISVMLPLVKFATKRFCACALEAISRITPAQTAPPNEQNVARMVDLNLVFIECDDGGRRVRWHQQPTTRKPMV